MRRLLFVTWVLLLLFDFAPCSASGDTVLASSGYPEDAAGETAVLNTGEGKSFSGFSHVIFKTAPAGGTVLIVELDRSVSDGEAVDLPAGHYTLRPQREGYRSADVVLDVDGITDRESVVELGEGFSPVFLSVHPVETHLTLDDQPLGPVPAEVELSEGHHRLVFSCDGYVSGTRDLSVEAGKSINLDIVLQRAKALVKVTTSPQGGKIFFGERAFGPGDVNLGELEYGQYTVRGEKELDGVTRLVGKVDFEISAADPKVFDLKLQDRERLYNGRWYPEDEALQLEAKRYRKLRVGNPVSVKAVMDHNAWQRLKNRKNLAAELHRILRVGDRIDVVLGKRVWTLWKRNGTPTEVFEQAVSSLKDRSLQELPWKSDTSVRRVNIRVGEDPLTEIALALHRKRTKLPLLELTGEQLTGGAETITRCANDGAITLICQGGTGVLSGGRSVPKIGNLGFSTLSAGNAAIKVEWEQPPEHLLVVCDRGAPFDSPVTDGSLKIHEKQILSISPGVEVARLVRLTDGPGYRGWKRQTIEANGPFAASIDLSRDEIGPHDRRGDYERVWLVYYGKQGAQTQRQIGIRYAVTGEAKKFRSDQFFRGESLSQPGGTAPWGE